MSAPVRSVGSGPQRLNYVRDIIQELFSAYAGQQSKHAKELSPNYEQFWQTISSYLDGGKRLRPYLILLAYEASGGKDSKGMVNIAGAWEALHAAMLIHDDIIDVDYIRHNKPNIAGTYRKRYAPYIASQPTDHYANSAALLAGDLALSAAYHFIMTSSLPADDRIFAADLLHEAIFTVSGGELLDMEASLHPHGTIDPRLIAEQKTACYSFITPLIVGAKLAGATARQVDGFTKLGTSLGVGYQLVDDMIGLFGDEKITGKSPLSDLREGKRTAILDKTCQLASDAERREIECILSSDNPGTTELNRVQELAVTTGAKASLESEIERLGHSARSELTELGLAPECESEFDWIIQASLQRAA